MYKHNFAEMEEAGVANRGVSPAQMNLEGNVVSKQNTFCCTVTHDIIWSNYCIVANEVGDNISIKGDGHIGCQKYLCEKGSVPHKKFSMEDKHFTLL